MLNLENELPETNPPEDSFQTIPPVKPSVFYLCGDFSEEDTSLIWQQVSSHVSDSSLLRLVSINYIPSINEQKLDGFTQVLEPFLTNDYWSDLFQGGILNREDLPGIGKLPSINIYLVLNFSGDTNSSMIDNLKAVSNRIKRFLKDKSNFNLSLILVGKKDISLEIIRDFFPKFKISEENTRGIAVEMGHVQECLITFMLSLVYSNQLEVINNLSRSALKSSDFWIYIGASSILVDFHAMREHINKLALKEVLSSFLETELNQPQKSCLKAVVEKRVNDSSIEQLNSSIEVLSMDMNFEREKGQIISSEIRHGSELYVKVRDPKKFTVEYLVGYFNQKTALLTEKSSITAGAEAQKHFNLLETILNGNLNPGIQGDEGSIFQTGHIPAGLSALIYGLEQLINTLNKVKDVSINNNPVSPVRLTSEAFYRAKSEEFLFYYKNGRIAIQRFFRRFASLPGTIVFLLPLIPLVYFALSSFFNLSQILSLVIGTIATLLIGSIEYILWEIKRTNKEYYLRFKWSDELTLKEKYQLSITKMITDFFLGIVAKINKDLRLQLISKLGEFNKFIQEFNNRIERSLQNLSVFFLSYRDKDFEAGTDVYKTEEKATLKLQKISYCEESAASVTSKLKLDHPEYNSYRDFIFREYVLKSITEKRNPKAILEKITKDISKLVDATIRIGHVQTYVLSDEINQLDEGKKWHWLDQKAVPFGRLTEQESHGMQFIFYCIGDEASLIGAYGKYSKFWPANAVINQSALINELQCIRGIMVSK